MTSFLVDVVDLGGLEVAQPLVSLRLNEVVVPLVEGWTVVAEVAQPLIMSGGADLFNFSDGIEHVLVGDMRLGFLDGKQFGRCLDSLLLVGHLAGALVDSPESLAFGVDVKVAWIIFGSGNWTCPMEMLAACRSSFCLVLRGHVVAGSKGTFPNAMLTCDGVGFPQNSVRLALDLSVWENCCRVGGAFLFCLRCY